MTAVLSEACVVINPKCEFHFTDELRSVIRKVKRDFINLQIPKIIEAVNKLHLHPDIYKVEVILNKSDIKIGDFVMTYEQIIKRNTLVNFPTAIIGVRNYKVWRGCGLDTPIKTLRYICYEKYGYYLDSLNIDKLYINRYPKNKLTDVFIDDSIEYKFPDVIDEKTVLDSHENYKKKYIHITQQLKDITHKLITKNINKVSHLYYQIKCKPIYDIDGTKLLFEDVVYNSDININLENSHWKVLGLKTPLEIFNSVAKEFGGVVIWTSMYKYYFTKHPELFISEITKKRETFKTKKYESKIKINNIIEEIKFVFTTDLIETPDFIPLPKIIGGYKSLVNRRKKINRYFSYADIQQSPNKKYKQST